jgi:hypothetical protein
MVLVVSLKSLAFLAIGVWHTLVQARGFGEKEDAKVVYRRACLHAFDSAMTEVGKYLTL